MSCPQGGECPDREACQQGAPCEVVKWAREAINERDSHDEG